MFGKTFDGFCKGGIGPRFKRGLFLFFFVIIFLGTFLGASPGSALRVLSASGFTMVFYGAFFLWAGFGLAILYGIMASRGWAIVDAVAFLAFLVLDFLGAVLVFGLLYDPLPIFKNVLIYAVCLLILRDSGFRSLFVMTQGQVKTEKFIGWSLAVLVAVMVLAYGFLYVKVARADQFKTSTLRITAPEKDPGPVRYTIEEFDGWQIPVPMELNIRKKPTSGPDGSMLSAVYSRSDKKAGIIVSKDDLLLALVRVYRLQDGYELRRRFMHEKIGMIPLILRGLIVPGDARVFEVFTPGLKGFMFSSSRKQGDSQIHAFDLFDDKGHYLNIVFAVRSGALARQEVDRIVARIKRVN